MDLHATLSTAGNCFVLFSMNFSASLILWQSVATWQLVTNLLIYLTVVVITPLTYTAYLNQPAVRFHCFTVNAHSVVWHIDGLILHGNELKARGIETTTSRTLLESNLTISSTIENNNTRIRCLARHLVEQRFVPSEEVVFSVQGQWPKYTYSCCSVMVE